MPFIDRHDPNVEEGPRNGHRQRLLESAREGDANAFARLYDIYADRVYEYMLFHVRDRQAAEDLGARVFLKAWRNIRCFEPEHLCFGVWLYLIARKAIIEFARTEPDGLVVREILSPTDEGLGEYQDLKLCFEV